MMQIRLQNKFLIINNVNKAKNCIRNNTVIMYYNCKLDYFSNINGNKFNDSKKIWKSIKLFLSDKSTLNHKTTLKDKREINKSDDVTRGVFRTQSNVCVLQCRLNFKNHPSILATL